MPVNEPDLKKTNSKSETGHAKFVESIERLIAADATLDAAKLNAPADLNSAALAALLPAATARHQKVGDSKAGWRTIALERRTDIEQITSMAAQAVALFESRGASKEKVEIARSYVRKIRGGGAKKIITPDNPATPDVDETEKGISKSQQSSAAVLSVFFELIDYLEAQPEYAGVTNAGFEIADLRDFADATQAKHTASITAVTGLSADRSERDAFFYNDRTSVLNLARRYKKLVFGAYGGKSPEYALVNQIPFQKPKK